MEVCVPGAMKQAFERPTAWVYILTSEDPYVCLRCNTSQEEWVKYKCLVCPQIVLRIVM